MSVKGVEGVRVREEWNGWIELRGKRFCSDHGVCVCVCVCAHFLCCFPDNVYKTM